MASLRTGRSCSMCWELANVTEDYRESKAPDRKNGVKWDSFRNAHAQVIMRLYNKAHELEWKSPPNWGINVIYGVDGKLKRFWFNAAFSSLF